MKNFILLLFFLVKLDAFGQIITENPTVDKRNSRNTKIVKVTITNESTILSLSYYQPTLEESFNAYIRKYPELRQQIKENPQLKDYYFQRFAMRSGGSVISFQPTSYLLAENGEKFKFIRVEGIPVSPRKIDTESGKTYPFKVYFEKLDKGIEIVDLIEGYSKGETDTHEYWNFYGIRINNPKEPKKIQEVPAEKKISPVVMLTVKGTLFDAETKKPIVGNITYQAESSDVKLKQSSATTTSGEYSFNISPRSYQFTAAVDGYETQTESLDLTSISKNIQITQDFYLKKIPQKLEPKVEEKPKKEETVLLPRESKESSPIKVEENKFRLDRVFFPLGESTILPDSYQQLDGLLDMMKANPKMNIVVEGHTDNVGDATQNKRLSLERAFNVREYLVNRGIAGSRIQFKGYGDTKPIATNDTEEGRQMNRRVEFVIVNK